MTFGRPFMMPNSVVQLDLPVNQSLERLTVMGSSIGSMSNVDAPDTVCFFTATMYVPILMF